DTMTDDTNAAKSEETETPQEKQAAEEAAVVDAVTDQIDLGKKNTKEAEEAAAKKKQEAIDKLVAEKKYFVPIGQVAKRRNQRVGIVLLVLLLLLAGAYLAMDAGLVDL